MIGFNESLLNISQSGGFTLDQAKLYVTIESCKVYVAQTTFFMYLNGLLFLIAIIVIAYLIKKYKVVF